MNWYELSDADTVASPALLVYPDRVLANIRQTIALVGGPDRLRPHVKTHKMRAVTDLLLAEGIRQFKCATLPEARMLAQAAQDGGMTIDVLLAYPLVGPSVARFAQLRVDFPTVRFACLIDGEVPARRLAEAGQTTPLRVFIDLNVGMNRTGIAPADAPGLFAVCRSLPGLDVVGLHAYDGHIHGHDPDERARQADASFALAHRVQMQIQKQFGQHLPLTMGGSTTFAHHAGQPDVLVSPGTFVFWDAGYAALLPDLPIDVAAVLLTRVISVIDGQTVCLDLGHKSVAAENPLPRVAFLNQPGAVPVSQSEEHLVVRVADSGQHQPGEVWYGVPVHICPTVNLYDSVQVVTNHQRAGEWAVTARGH